MAFQPAPRVAEVRINQRLHQQEVQNTLYFGGSVDWTAQSLEVLAGEIITWVGTQLYVPLSNELTLASVECRDLTTENAPFFIGTPTVPVAGDVQLPALPGNCAFVISFRSGLTGRSARGRNYVAGIPEAQAAGNSVSQTLVADPLVAAYEALPGIAQQFGAVHVILSRQTANQQRPTAFGFVVTSYIYTDLFIDSQRGRLTGRGN
jgi:hypothetical protein